MKNSIRLAGAISAVVLCCGAVQAAPALNMKPGLWESTSKVDFGNSEMGNAMAQFQKQMANMPPEQRKAMADAMAKHSGGKMPAMTMNSDGGTSMTSCVTREMIDKGMLPMPAKAGCTQTNSPVVNGAVDSTMTCTNPPSTSQMHFQSRGDSAFTMTIRSASTINGKQQPMNVDVSGKWLSADCGSVKPIVIPPQQ